MAVLEDVTSPPAAGLRPRGVGRREKWQRRLPLLPALVYTIVVTQVPFLVTLWYSFQSYFWNEPGGAHWTGVSNYKEVFTDPSFRSALVRSVTMTAIASRTTINGVPYFCQAGLRRDGACSTNFGDGVAGVGDDAGDVAMLNMLLRRRATLTNRRWGHITKCRVFRVEPVWSDDFCRT